MNHQPNLVARAPQSWAAPAAQLCIRPLGAPGPRKHLPEESRHRGILRHTREHGEQQEEGISRKEHGEEGGSWEWPLAFLLRIASVYSVFSVVRKKKGN